MIYYCIKDFQQFKIGHKFDFKNGYIINGLLNFGYISKDNPIKKVKKDGIKSNKNNNRKRTNKHI